MAINHLLDRFELLKNLRRSQPENVLVELGNFASAALSILRVQAIPHTISWEGAGDKRYKIFTDGSDNSHWSRAVNVDLFLDDPNRFDLAYARLVNQVVTDRGQLQLQGLTNAEINIPFYTAIMAFAVVMDLYSPSRGMQGTFFEMMVGPFISLLTDRVETGDVVLAVPGSEEPEVIKVDLTFDDPAGGVSLAVPTKISTRERISQAFVHARILETARPGRYRTALCVVNENNAYSYKGMPKGPSSIYLRDTLVPRTIALYQRYVAKIDGLYYLDPPQQYIAKVNPALPPVKPFGMLALGDLTTLLT